MPCRYAAAAILLAVCPAGCSSLGGAWLESTKQQYRRAVKEIKADMSVLESDDDGLDAFPPGDAKYMRAARAEMNR
jgi:outer membrane murein-binding lipoprotein Lpp